MSISGAAQTLTGTMTSVKRLAEGDQFHLEPHTVLGCRVGHRVLDVMVVKTEFAHGAAEVWWCSAGFTGSPPRLCGVATYNLSAEVLVIGHSRMRAA